jgi:dGTPase
MGLRTWLFQNVYRGGACSRENEKAARVVLDLFEHYLRHEELRTRSDPDPVVKTVDFVAGMTDRYALATYRRIFLPQGEVFA